MSDTSKKQKLLHTGAEIFGAAIGGAIGLVAGPAGAIGGGVAGVIVSKGLIEFADRVLSYREQARVGAAAGLTIVGIQNRIDIGQQLRHDNFFESEDIHRSKAEELFEGILLKCKNEYEEKKIKYITKIYENVAFDTSVLPEHANQILNLVQQLTYRQLSLLSFVGQNIDNIFEIRNEDYRRNETYDFSIELQFLLQNIMELERRGLIYRNDNQALLYFGDVASGKMTLTEIGKDYYKLMNLYEMPNTEFNFIELLK